MAPRLSAQDKKWQRESDAHTLAQAEEIKLSPSRMKGAVKEAKVMAKRTEIQVKAMKKVAGKAKSVTRRSKPVTQTNKKTPLTTAKKRK